jgi:hypothetical protein
MASYLVCLRSTARFALVRRGSCSSGPGWWSRPARLMSSCLRMAQVRAASRAEWPTTADHDLGPTQSVGYTPHAPGCMEGVRRLGRAVRAGRPEPADAREVAASDATLSRGRYRAKRPASASCARAGSVHDCGLPAGQPAGGGGPTTGPDRRAPRSRSCRGVWPAVWLGWWRLGRTCSGSFAATPPPSSSASRRRSGSTRARRARRGRGAERQPRRAKLALCGAGRGERWRGRGPCAPLAPAKVPSAFVKAVPAIKPDRRGQERPGLCASSHRRASARARDGRPSGRVMASSSEPQLARLLHAEPAHRSRANRTRATASS